MATADVPIEEQAKRYLTDFAGVIWTGNESLQFYAAAKLLIIEFNESAENGFLQRIEAICLALMSLPCIQKVHLYCRNTFRVYKLALADLISSSTLNENGISAAEQSQCTPLGI